MIVRSLVPSDIEQLRAIHEKYYKEEFSFEEFQKNFLDAFAVVDYNSNIICAGGVRLIAESVIVTNKDFSPLDRKAALLEVLKISLEIAKHHGYDQLHAFIQDEKWLRKLKDYGFRDTKGKSLVIG